MKKLIVLFLVAGYCIAGRAVEPSNSWIISDAGKLEAKRVDIGISKARVILANGEKKSIPLDQLSSYSVNGQVFTRLPLYKNGKPTGKQVFMELVKTRGDYSLYQYEYWDNDLIKSYQKVKTAFLFNGENFQMQLDEKTLPDVAAFFGVRPVIE